MSFFYAESASGPSAGGIGWFHFGNLSISSGDTITGLTGTLHDGSIVTFDLSLVNTSGQPRVFTAGIVPADADSLFARAGYTGLAGNVTLFSDANPAGLGVNTFTISNITVVDANHDPVPNFTVILADAETTNVGEAWSFQTDGGVWQLLATLGGNLPSLTGLGTQNADITGTQPSPQGVQASYLLSTQAPSQLILTAVEAAGGWQAVSIGFATTRIRLQKYVAERVDDSDQFVLDITGMAFGQATTAGTANGLQPQTVQVYGPPGFPYYLNESMAPGSVSQLYQYTTVVSAVNATPGGSFPPTGSLPISFTPALGDDVTYTFYNQVSYTYHKTVDRTYAELGDVLTYTVFIPNPNPYPITDVQFTDPTPLGMTYLGDLWVDKPYTGTNPDSGLVITSIPANGSVTILWRTRIDAAPPVPNPLVNVGYVEIPSGNSGVTSFATTNIVTAHITMQKAVSKAYAQPGEFLTYILTLHNTGNVVANSVTITDELPIGVALVPGSLTGAKGVFPTLTLNGPLTAGGTATVSYQVKIGDAIPAPNPITNSASLVFRYTVDPTHPSAKTGAAQSNTVTTLVQAAILILTKSSDRPVSHIGDIITYRLAVRNAGNVPAEDVVITHALTVGTDYVPGSLSVNVPATGDPITAIVLTDPIAPGQTVTVLFRVLVDTIPNPNPISSAATASYSYSVDPNSPINATASASSNMDGILVFRYNFSQQITDLIHSVALEQAGLAAMINAEGAKIQVMVAMNSITTQELLCLNKSVTDMTDSIAMLEAVLKQKLGVVDCQINSGTYQINHFSMVGAPVGIQEPQFNF